MKMLKVLLLLLLLYKFSGQSMYLYNKFGSGMGSGVSKRLENEDQGSESQWNELNAFGWKLLIQYYILSG